jgi:hypothetical protein
MVSASWIFMEVNFTMPFRDILLRGGNAGRIEAIQGIGESCQDLVLSCVAVVDDQISETPGLPRELR